MLNNSLLLATEKQKGGIKRHVLKEQPTKQATDRHYDSSAEPSGVYTKIMPKTEKTYRGEGCFASSSPRKLQAAIKFQAGENDRLASI